MLLFIFFSKLSFSNSRYYKPAVLKYINPKYISKGLEVLAYISYSPLVNSVTVNIETNELSFNKAAKELTNVACAILKACGYIIAY